MERADFVRHILERLDVTGWGISRTGKPDEEFGLRGRDITAARFGCSITLYRAYELPREADPLTGGQYDEGVFDGVLTREREKGLEQVERLCESLDEVGISRWVFPPGQDPDTLVGPFSQKRAAVRAGLGWIGKCTLFVTGKYGPRVKLFTVLADIEPPAQAPLAPVECGRCSACVDACPYGYLSGAPWDPSAAREDLIDAFACSLSMERRGEPLGRKHSCGICLLACPLGVGGRGS